MELIGLMVVRSEAWVLPASLPAALQWVDELVVLMHRCTDQTEEIVRDMARKDPCLNITHSNIQEWDEAFLRGMALETGRMLGATHLALIDADEILTTGGVERIRQEASDLKPGELLRLPWLQCWRGLTHYRSDDSPFGNARVPFVFRDAPWLKYSPDDDGYQFHKRYPFGCQTKFVWGRDSGEGVLHLQHANWQRVVAKQKRYAEDEKRRWGHVRANYAAATDETGLETKPIPRDWWPVDPALVDLEAVAWQAQ